MKVADTAKSVELIFSTDFNLVKKTLNNPPLLEQAAKESFNLVDLNKDNKISLKEFELFLLEIEKRTYAEEEPYLNKDLIEKTFKEFDYDKSGKIEFNEFLDVFRDLLQANFMGLKEPK